MTHRILLSAVLTLGLGCSPLVGAMLDKPRDASTDVSAEITPYCESSDQCPDGYYCMKEPCEATVGKCTKIPDSCDGVPEDLVCACDAEGNSVDHRNECEMKMAMHSKKYSGRCVRCESSACTFRADVGCGPNCFCDGDCSAPESGRCLPESSVCDPGVITSEPVCGCLRDGNEQTYDNDCDRLRAGAWLKHYGPCEAMECYENDPTGVCGPEQFCEGPVDACGSGMAGSCMNRQTSCDIYDPMCGCDGTTYGNDCERQAMGVWLRHPGECGGTTLDCEAVYLPDGTFFMDTCTFPEFCELPPGSCPGNSAADPSNIIFTGICVDPNDCNTVPLPCVTMDVSGDVCSCDNRRFPSDCERRKAGVRGYCCRSCPCIAPVSGGG
jgi:hypothetical protein